MKKELICGKCRTLQLMKKRIICSGNSRECFCWWCTNCKDQISNSSVRERNKYIFAQDTLKEIWEDDDAWDGI